MDKLLEKIEKAGHIVVISHVNPDADSLGSASAMYTFLLQRHKKVSWFCKSGDIDSRLSFLPWFENIRTVIPSSAELAISFDCGDRGRLGTDVGCELVNIDHHATNELYGDLNIVDASYISTTALLFDLFKKSGANINKKMATALYAGVLGDSEAFMSESVDGTTFALVSELIALGAQYGECNQNMLKSTSLAAIRLKGVIFNDMSLCENAKVAFFCVNKEQMKATGALQEDIKRPLFEALNIVHVQAAFALVELADGSIKGSLRSKGGVDVGRIAFALGGGGHVARAGFILKESSLEDAKSRVLNFIKKEL